MVVNLIQEFFWKAVQTCKVVYLSQKLQLEQLPGVFVAHCSLFQLNKDVLKAVAQVEENCPIETC